MPLQILDLVTASRLRMVVQRAPYPSRRLPSRSGLEL